MTQDQPIAATIENCPTCGEPSRIRCKCPDSHARCANGHWWSRRTGELSDGPHMASKRP